MLTQISDFSDDSNYGPHDETISDWLNDNPMHSSTANSNPSTNVTLAMASSIEMSLFPTARDKKDDDSGVNGVDGSTTMGSGQEAVGVGGIISMNGQTTIRKRSGVV